jgi:hypothetical protein
MSSYFTYADDIKLLKKGIWLYFLLIIFEGALRKWILPGLANPLLIVRDPIALWLIVMAWRRGLLPSNIYMTVIVIIGIVSIFSATLLGHGSLAVALFGARILLLHFPLLFVIGRVFTRADVVKMGLVTMWIAIPMAVLIALQFYSPQSAWVNRGVGGDMAGAGFSGANGYFRPPATFSFTIGTHLFFGFASCFVYYFWLHPKEINRVVLIGATIGLLASIPFSISRSLLLYVGFGLLFTIIGMLRKPQNLGRIIILLLGITAVLALLSQVSVLQAPIEAFVSRFTAAADAEGGVTNSFSDRYLGGALGALSDSSEQPFLGYGVGMGTNVGSQLLTGKKNFLISEGEWGRLIGELGPLLGICVILVRVGLTVKLFGASYQKLTQNDLLPWILLANALLVIPQAQWAQPTFLGFSTMIAGLLIASFREKDPILEEQEQAVAHTIPAHANG